MGVNILIVDDDPVVRHILGSVLKAAGHIVEQALSGAACIELLSNRTGDDFPALIFLDLQLGDMTGADVLAEIRRITAPNDVPVIMLSANSEAETQALFPELKADGYLEKPFPPQRVLEVLQAVVGSNVA